MFWIEVTATLFGFACVVLTIRRHIWCWPVGLIQVLLFLIIFYDARLYSDLLLHVIYVGMQLYGWYTWSRRTSTDDDGSLVVGQLMPVQVVSWMLVAATGTLLLGYTMGNWTDAAFPYADAFTTAASLVAQYLLARRWIETWWFWILVDIVAIAIYWQKNLIPTAILYSVFLVLAVIGLATWTRRLQQQAMRPRVV